MIRQFGDEAHFIKFDFNEIIMNKSQLWSDKIATRQKAQTRRDVPNTGRT